MAWESPTPGLLELLARQMGTDILSDLRDPLARDALLRLIRQLPAQRYSSAQWKEALCYLLQTDPFFLPGDPFFLPGDPLDNPGGR